MQQAFTIFCNKVFIQLYINCSRVQFFKRIFIKRSHITFHHYENLSNLFLTHETGGAFSCPQRVRNCALSVSPRQGSQIFTALSLLSFSPSPSQLHLSLPRLRCWRFLTITRNFLLSYNCNYCTIGTLVTLGDRDGTSTTNEIYCTSDAFSDFRKRVSPFPPLVAAHENFSPPVNKTLFQTLFL